MKDFGYVVKDINTNEYYCGMNKWDIQLRKAQIYHSIKYAENMLADKRWTKRTTTIKTVELISEEETKADERSKTTTELESRLLKIKYNDESVFEFVSVDSILKMFEQMKDKE